MSLSLQPPGQEMVTQESLLLGAAERIGRIREGYAVAHLHLSRLRPHNRDEARLRIAVRMLEPLAQFRRAQLFLLGTGDIIILAKDVTRVELDNLVYRLRALFSRDPLTYADTGDGRDRFVSWYDLETDYDAFLALARRFDDEARRRRKQREGSPPRPLEPRDLHEVMERLAGMDLAGLVRRQSAIVIRDRRAEVFLQEFFVSMGDLQRQLSPQVSLLGNRWLFQHLSQTLDVRLLAVVRDMALRRMPPAVSLNLNVTTLMSDAFAAFARAAAGRLGLVAELQAIDVFADLGSYAFARDQLHRAGHAVLLDGLDGHTLHMMDPSLYGADLFKLFWSPELADDAVAADVANALAPVGWDRVILGRCDSEAAIQWGMEMGIQRFQGRYVDAMQAAMKMAVCPMAKRCTLSQCIHRHGVIAGRPRGECYHLETLDSFPELRAPGRRPATAADGRD